MGGWNPDSALRAPVFPVGARDSPTSRRRESSAAFAALALPSYLLIANVAGIAAWWETFRRQREAMWEPTRRESPAAPECL